MYPNEVRYGLDILVIFLFLKAENDKSYTKCNNCLRLAIMIFKNHLRN